MPLIFLLARERGTDLKPHRILRPMVIPPVPSGSLLAREGTDGSFTLAAGGDGLGVSSVLQLRGRWVSRWVRLGGGGRTAVPRRAYGAHAIKRGAGRRGGRDDGIGLSISNDVGR